MTTEVPNVARTNNKTALKRLSTNPRYSAPPFAVLSLERIPYTANYAPRLIILSSRIQDAFALWSVGGCQESWRSHSDGSARGLWVRLLPWPWQMLQVTHAQLQLRLA